MGYSVSTVNVLVDKLLDFDGHDGHECFGLNPFGEVVNNHYSVLNATSSLRKLTD